jgi:acetyl esterase/lipase
MRLLALLLAMLPQSAPAVSEHVYKRTTQGELKLFVHRPPDWKETDKRPAIVFFFGGGWTSGKVDQFARQAEYLARRGMVAARADYRVKSRHQVTPDKCVEDAKSAVRWLRKNAAALGTDPDRIVASGGSAGGHIAACTAIVEGFEAEGEDASVSSKPNALVLFNPALDMVAIGERFGVDAETARKISPNHNLRRDLPPAILFFGTADRLSDPAKEFLAKSKELGNRVEMETADGQAHGYFNRPPWQERTLRKADEFLASLGYLQGPPTIEAK